MALQDSRILPFKKVVGEDPTQSGIDPTQVLQDFLDSAQGPAPMRANDPIKLAGLRGQRENEMAHNLDLAKSAKSGTYATGATESDLTGLRKDIAEDPFTGLDEQARVAKRQNAMDVFQEFMNPDQKAMREEQEAATIRKSTAPVRAGHESDVPVEEMRGNAARDVAQINANATLGAAGAKQGGNLSPSLVEAMAGAGAALTILDELDAMAPTVSTGPYAGRIQEAQQDWTPDIPGMPQVDPRFPPFLAKTKNLANTVIKSITGAQMSEPEARRIMGQIPLHTDRRSVRQAKSLALRRQLTDLNNRRSSLAQTGQQQQPAQPDQLRQMAKEFGLSVDDSTFIPSAPSAGGSGGTIKLMAPDGSIADVPATQLQHFLSLGAKQVQ